MVAAHADQGSKCNMTLMTLQASLIKIMFTYALCGIAIPVSRELII